jgi:hypothetical protein
MFVVVCPKCEKRLNLPDTTHGKHVRCAGCLEIVLATTEPPAAGLPPTPPARKSAPLPPRLPLPEEQRAQEPADEASVGPVPDAVPGLSCPYCEAAAVVELPPNANSRRPGYICAMCRREMRPAGSAGNYYAAVLLGTVIALLGIGLIVVAFNAKQGRDKLVGGGAAVAVLGAVVAGWSYRQTRLQVPHGAEAAPSRFGFWLTILLIGAVLLAGGIFGLKLLASGSA